MHRTIDAIKILRKDVTLARKPADQSVSRDDIIVAAAEVLRRNGYEATTMKDIAAEVNLTAASLYHHFRNKDTLLLAVLEGGIDQVIAMMEPVVHSDMANVDKLRELIRAHVASLTKHTAVGAAMIFEIRPLLNFKAPANNGNHAKEDTYSEFTQRRDAFFQRRDYFEELFRCVLQDGIDAGEFRQVDTAIFTKAMLGAHNWVAVWYKEGGRLDGNTIADMMADQFLRALAP